MLTLHTKNVDLKNSSKMECSYKIIENESSTKVELPSTSSASKDISDPTISAKKLPKKRKFIPPEIDELDNVNVNIGSSVIKNINDETLHKIFPVSLETPELDQLQSKSFISYEDKQVILYYP